MDLRPLLESALDAFSVPAVVLLPDGVQVETRAFWLPPTTEEVPMGNDLRRAEPRRMLVIPSDEVPQVPRGAIVTMPEIDGGDELEWRVDSADRVDPDHIRVFVVPHGEPQ